MKGKTMVNTEFKEGGRTWSIWMMAVNPSDAGKINSFSALRHFEKKGLIKETMTFERRTN